jgi:hypothetical protein
LKTLILAHEISDSVAGDCQIGFENLEGDYEKFWDSYQSNPGYWYYKAPRKGDLKMGAKNLRGWVPRERFGIAEYWPEGFWRGWRW